MKMADSQFDDVQHYLAKKYPVKSKNIPFVGDRYVKYAQGDSIVELDDPHLSFEMNVRYLNNALVRAFNQRSSENEAQRKKNQGGKF